MVSARALIFMAAIMCLTGAKGQLTAESSRERNEFTLNLSPPAGSTGGQQCNVITGGTPVSGPIRWLVQNGTSLSLNVALDQSAPQGAALTLVNMSAQSPFVSASVANGRGLVSYQASGYSSPQATVTLGISVSGSVSCILTLNLGADLSTQYVFDGSMNPNVSISPFAPSGLDPRRNCYTTGARADATVQGPFRVLVPNPGSVTFTSTVPLTAEGGPNFAPGATVVVSGTQFQSATYTATANSLPTQLNLGLGNQCGVTVYFVPLPASTG